MHLDLLRSMGGMTGVLPGGEGMGEGLEGVSKEGLMELLQGKMSLE